MGVCGGKTSVVICVLRLLFVHHSVLLPVILGSVCQEKQSDNQTNIKYGPNKRKTKWSDVKSTQKSFQGEQKTRNLIPISFEITDLEHRLGEKKHCR